MAFRRLNWLIVGLLLWAGQTDAVTTATEYEIKAAFLYNLGNFIIWPKTALSTDTTEFALCILGTDPFGKTIDILTEAQRIADRPIRIRRLLDIEQARGCHIVFISKSEQLRLDDIFAWLEDKPIVTVGDTDNFLIRGGMVKFFPHHNKVRLALDIDTLKKMGLTPTAHLLRVVDKMRP